MISFFIKPKELNTVNIIISKLQFNDDVKGKIDLSICKAVALKLARKSFSLLGKDKAKHYKITIEYHEAELLERKIRYKANLDYETHQLSENDFFDLTNFYNDLNQKLA